MVTEEQVLEALQAVKDPEIGFSIVDLGLVYKVEIEEGTVRVDMTLTALGCPAAPQIVAEAREAIEALPDVKQAEVNLVWLPRWTPDRIKPELRWILGR